MIIITLVLIPALLDGTFLSRVVERCGPTNYIDKVRIEQQDASVAKVTLECIERPKINK
jgi:hypothetical protein